MSYAKGDKVSWNTSQGETHGRVTEKRTSDFTFAGQKFRPTDEDPYYIVESDKTGAQAAHKESALRARS
jgi:Hypervirulence associated proteins TUDOR domain